MDIYGKTRNGPVLIGQIKITGEYEVLTDTGCAKRDVYTANSVYVGKEVTCASLSACEWYLELCHEVVYGRQMRLSRQSQ